MTTPFPTTIDQPIGISRFGVGAGHRALAKVRLRLRQSSRGYATAARLTSSSNLNRFAERLAARRNEDLARFEQALWESRVHAGMLADVAGAIHRHWMRMIASGSPATLSAEIDRGEAALERTIGRALRLPPVSPLETENATEELRQLLRNVTETRRALRELPTHAAGSST